jgi:hypothetical protein
VLTGLFMVVSMNVLMVMLAFHFFPPASGI